MMRHLEAKEFWGSRSPLKPMSTIRRGLILIPAAMPATHGSRVSHVALLLREGERVVKHYCAPEALEEACAIPVAVRASHMDIDVTVRAAKRTTERRFRGLSHGQ